MPNLASLHVAVIGGGPAGLMAADVVSAAGARVTIYDRMPSVARKFLMAGRGGLNLTHSEDIAAFMARYGERAPQLRPALEALPPEAVRSWCEGLGQPTFVGSSGRVFPAAMKTSPLLRAWLRTLGARGVELATRHDWQGWDDAAALRFDTPTGTVIRPHDAVVLALGGASWPGLGSNGAWFDILHRVGIPLHPLLPSNSGFGVAWSAPFKERFQGHPLKRIAIRHAGRTVRGEALVTADGIEGGAIYAMSGPLRDAIARDGAATVYIDLRPDIDLEAQSRQLETPRRKQSITTYLRKTARLSPEAVGLLQEHAHNAAKPLGELSPADLAALVKSVPLKLISTAPIARAISSAGGVAWDALTPDFMLTARPGTFVAGEMIDWEAPTGGYLLQACLSTGAAAGRGVVAWLAHQPATQSLT